MACTSLQCHFTACTEATLGILPEATSQNKSITDIKVDNTYFDNAIEDNFHVLIGGVVNENSLYQRINFSQCLFRGTAGNTLDCVRIEVDDTGNFVTSGKKLKDISFNQCEFTQAKSRGIQAMGLNNSSDNVEVSNLAISDCIFSDNNYRNLSTLTGTAISVSVHDLTVSNNIFMADENPGRNVVIQSLSNTDTVERSVSCTGNNLPMAICH